MQEDLGTIERGKLAHLVIVEGNPLVDIRDTTRVRQVIRDGEVIAVADLLASPKK